MVNTLRKLYLLGACFAIGYPVALMARLLFGQDSDNIYAWPDNVKVSQFKLKKMRASFRG